MSLGKMAAYVFWRLGFHHIGSAPCLGLLIKVVNNHLLVNSDEVFFVDGERWIYGEASRLVTLFVIGKTS
jgi:hypothetical protein